MFCDGAIRAVDLELGCIGRARRHGALVVMSEGRRALMGKVRVGVGSWTQGLVERVTFTSGRGAPQTTDGRKEFGLAEGCLAV